MFTSSSTHLPLVYWSTKTCFTFECKKYLLNTLQLCLQKLFGIYHICGDYKGAHIPQTTYNILELATTECQERSQTRLERLTGLIWPTSMAGESLRCKVVLQISSDQVFLAIYFSQNSLWGLFLLHKRTTKSLWFPTTSIYFSFMTCVHCGSALSLLQVQKVFSLDTGWWSSCEWSIACPWGKGKKEHCESCTGSETSARKWLITCTGISFATAHYRAMPKSNRAGLCKPPLEGGPQRETLNTGRNTPIFHIKSK